MRKSVSGRGGYQTVDVGLKGFRAAADPTVMKNDFTEHPLGTPGLSARRMARSAEAGRPGLRFLSSLFPGIRSPGSTWQKGAEGEEAVAKRLAKLPRDEWMVLHDRPLGSNGRNVDHLVIGPAGVFSVNTKNLSGKVTVKPNAFLVNGFPERYLHVSRDEAARVAERLSAVTGERVAVHAVIVVLADAVDVEAQPEGVHVLDVKQIPRWFRARPPSLDPRQTNRIYEATRKGGTWREDVSALRSASST
jgi:hypothetical protein